MCLCVCLYQSVHKSSRTNFPRDFQEISRIDFYKIPEDVYVTSHRPTTTREIIVILFTVGLSYVHCPKNRLTRENYIDNYKIFQEHKLNSRRFLVFPGVPGVADTLYGYLRAVD